MKFLATKSSALLLKSFVVYLGISLALLLTPARLTDPVRGAVLYPFRIAQQGFHRLGGPLERQAARVADLWSATREVNDLRRRNEHLCAQLVQEAERRHAAESRLAQLGQLPAEVQSRGIAAALIAFDSSPLRRTADFDQGAQTGVAVNAPVLWNGALIGRVSSVGPWSCKAVLLGDRQCRIAVRCARTRVQGVLEGIGGGMAAVKYIPVSADVQAGDLFVSSGVDGLFPAGLLVGACTEASAATGSIFKWVVVAPAFDPALLENVSLLLPESGK